MTNLGSWKDGAFETPSVEMRTKRGHAAPMLAKAVIRRLSAKSGNEGGAI
jgi:hypothetical protein